MKDKTKQTIKEDTKDYSSTYPEGFFELFGSIKDGIEEPEELKMDKENISV